MNSELNPVNFDHITTIIFDMDGTLIEHTWRLSQITETLFNHFAAELAPVTHDEFYDRFWSRNEDMWYMMVDGVLSGEIAAKYSYVNTLRSLGQDTALAEPMLACWHKLVLQEARPFADTFPVLEALGQKYTTGILTNGFKLLQRAKIERYNLASYVDFVLVSEEVGYHKPDKRIFLQALEKAGQPLPQQTLYIGDSLAADIEPARQIGLTPIFMNPHDDLEPPDGVIKINRLSALLSLVGAGS